MDAAVHGIRTGVEWLLWPLDALPATLALTLVAALTAVLMLVVVKRTSPQALTRRARDGMAASIYEMRLFLDEPRRVVRAQGRLIGCMVLYLGTLLPSLVVLGPPLGLLYLHLEVRHGLAPIRAPAELVLRVELERGVDGHAVEVTCDGPVEVTAPILFAADEPAAYVRLAVRAPGTHTVTVHAGGETATKRIVAEPGAAAVAPERASGLALLWSFGDEPPPGGGAIVAISLAHPPRPQSWLGLGIPWWLYWLAVATVIALVLRRRFDVVF